MNTKKRENNCVESGRLIHKHMKMSMFSLLILFATFLGCEKNNPAEPSCTNCSKEEEGPITGTYDPKPYDLVVPDWFPPIQIPEDNPLTVDGVALGRMLFYDPILSSDSTMSCASCHQLNRSFTEPLAKSIGVLGLAGPRNAMPLINLGFQPAGFFWDGRTNSLEEQALIPIEDHLEMNETWDHVEQKLRRHPTYPTLFRQAFGINQKSALTRTLAVKAIAQFERILVSSNSRFDEVVWQNKGWPTDAEERGRKLFFVEPLLQDDNHPGCSHCHGGPLFSDFLFRNNGLDSVVELTDFADIGRGGVNNNVFDNGKFKVPSLRNVALTAPYMHDGRFETLEEVIDSYSQGGHGVINEDPNIQPFSLSDRDKQDLIAFLHMLTDTTFSKNPAYRNPFEE